MKKHPDYICEYNQDADGFYVTWYPFGIFDDVRGEVFPTYAALTEALQQSSEKSAHLITRIPGLNIS